MIVKHTYSIPNLWEPDVEGVTTKQLASSGREVTALKLSAGAGSAVVALYDNGDGNANPTDRKWVLDASTTDNDGMAFSSPLSFKKGIYAVLEQGAGLGAKLNYAILPDQV